MTGILNILAGSIASAIRDGFFNLTTLLLSGNGTNGAQNNTFLDSSTNNFTITRNGNATQGTFSPFSQTGWSNYFSGSGNYLSIAYNVALAPASGDFTVEAFVMFNSFSTTGGQDQIVVGNLNGSTGAGDWAILYRASPQRFEFVGSSTGAAAGIQRAFYAPASFVPGKWYHLVGVKNGSTLSVYVDGVKGTDATLATVNNSSTATIIGAGASNTTPIVGYISNLRVVKGTALYSGSTITVPTAELTAVTNTSLLTCQSNRFRDNSANNFTLTPTGTPSVQAFSPFAPTAAYSAATNGGSGYFDGSGDYLDTNYSASVSGNYAVEFWFYLTTVSSQSSFFTIGNAASSTGIDFYYSSTSNQLVVLTNGTAVITTGAALKTNTWYHAALVRSGSSNILYLNGVQVGSTWTSSTTFSGTFRIGVEYTTAAGGYMNGYISSFRFSNTNRAATVPTSPYTSDANTQLLLNFTNAGIIDATGKNVLETVGNAQISTTQSKFGGSSLAFDGTGDVVAASGAPVPIGTLGDFTAEAWIYTTSSADQTIFYLNGGTSSFAGCRVGINTNKIYLLVSTSGSAWAINSGNLGTINSNTWYHVAAVRNGGTFTLYVDGVSVFSSTSVAATTALMTGSLNYVGSANSSGVTLSFNGYIDDARVSRLARYTANFTAPTAAFALQ